MTDQPRWIVASVEHVALAPKTSFEVSACQSSNWESLAMTDQPSEAQLRERAKWSNDDDTAAIMLDAVLFGKPPAHQVVGSNSLMQGNPSTAQGLNACQAIPPAYIAAHQIAVGAAPIEARVKALETALAVLHDRLATQESAWRRLLATETEEKPDAGPQVVIAHKVPDKPAEPEAPIHAAIRASSAPKPMVGPMGNPQPK